MADATKTRLGGDAGSTLRQGDRDREVAYKARRVVAASLGVMRDQKVRRKRGLALAAAAILLVVLCLGPLVYMVVDHFNSGGNLGEMTTELNLWVCIFCPAVLAAALVGGWLRKR